MLDKLYPEKALFNWAVEKNLYQGKNREANKGHRWKTAYPEKEDPGENQEILIGTEGIEKENQTGKDSKKSTASVWETENPGSGNIFYLHTSDIT